MVWRRTGLNHTCASCGSNHVIPTDSPEYRKKLSEQEDSENRMKCPECAELVLKEAKKCKHCGSILASL
jgi:predicted RNA-binding Zn-ribbon protein involved in translation (DUF1610 family)